MCFGAKWLLATKVQATREETKPRKPAASRTSKRKAKVPEPEPEPEQLSDEEQMDVDEVKAEEQDDNSDQGGAATPDRASETETEDEGEGGFSTKVSAPTRATRGRTAQAPRSSSLTAGSQKSTTAPDEDAGPPPPRRELPFGKPATRSKPAAKQPAPVANGEDDETEDEEL